MTSTQIEPLESRIAPAAVFVFTDVDGDHVKITSSKGTNADLAAAVNHGTVATSTPVGLPHQLQDLVLNATFAGAKISITATPSNDLDTGSPIKSGDGFVNVGEIDAHTIDLASVTVHGDLGQILVGDANPKHPGIGSLSVESMGAFGLTTGAAGTGSFFENGATSIKVANDVNAVFIRAFASGALPSAKFGSIFIGGDLIGGAAADTGEIVAADAIGSVKIFGNIIGGTAIRTGGITNNTTSGVGTGTIGSVFVGGDLTGAQFSSADAVDHSGFIRAQGDLKSVTIVGNVISGIETGGGALTFSGSIQSGATLGTVKISGGIEGNVSTPVLISGAGLAAPTKKSGDPAIKSLSVAKTADYAVIEGGYDTMGNTTTGDAQIGSVKVGGDLIATDIIAGVKSADAFFGNGPDTTIDKPAGVNTDLILSSIGSIVVGGQIEGTTAGMDSFGIEAQLIGSIKTGSVTLPLLSGAGDDAFYLSRTTQTDVHVREFAGS